MTPEFITAAKQTRACFFCAYAINTANPDQARCNAPQVTHARLPIPLSEAWASDRVTDCGPEARYFLHVNPRARE